MKKSLRFLGAQRKLRKRPTLVVGKKPNGGCQFINKIKEYALPDQIVAVENADHHCFMRNGPLAFGSSPGHHSK